MLAKPTQTKNENLRSLSFIKDCRDRACPCPKRKVKPKFIIFV
jgi:hypothetical protein